MTSYVFRNGKIEYGNLEKLVRRVGKSRIVLDLSCRRKDGAYYIVTDRWQTYTDVKLSEETLEELSFIVMSSLFMRWMWKGWQMG